MNTQNTTAAIDWNNVNLSSPYESSQNLLDGYDFDTLLMEVECNLPTLTKETIKAQAMLSIKQKYNTAIEILNSNLDNILKEALKYRNSK
jgi:hypothetical protein